MKTNYYKVAEQVFCISAEDRVLDMLSNYAPFVTEKDEPVFQLTVCHGEAVSYEEEMRQEDEGQDIICGKQGENQVFEFRWADRIAGWLVSEPNYQSASLVLTGYAEKMAVDNALMVLFALATAGRRTLLFHAAVVSYEGYAYMFLGKSGTGKSTHAALWLKYINGTERVNDDNPVVRIDEDGKAVIYGSPWSGKTPCYRNVSYPLGGFVQLSQAPYNKITPLMGVAAYAVLVPSISGKRWDRAVADGLHETENALLQKVQGWYLECLPDEAAAELCNRTITVRQK